jgi:hypothetical protein
MITESTYASIEKDLASTFVSRILSFKLETAPKRFAPTWASAPELVM